MDRYRDDVVLASMPWAPVHEPSLALGLLSSSLRDNGFAVTSFHFAPEFLRWLSADTYQLVSDSWAVNEFMFSGSLAPETDTQQLETLDALCRGYETEQRSQKYKTASELYELFLEIRNVVVPQLVRACADRILDRRPRLVGFTCMFDQTIASVAVAAELKRNDPSISIALGGYALFGQPGREVAKAFPWIDQLVIGDGESVIVDLATRLWEGDSRSRRLSLYLAGVEVIEGAKVDLESSPIPTYDDWFTDIDRLQSDHQVQVQTRVLPLEASRGCWWGQRSHCVFCGIDEESLVYRHKSADRVLETLDMLTDTYGTHVFRFADYIMPRSFYTDLLPELSERIGEFRLEGEIKANQSPERVALMASAGFEAVQPGIESFSTPVLQLMDKGVRGIDNVQLLKNAFSSRLILYYNILYGFPAEQRAWYEEMVTKLPMLYHLIPPVGRTPVVVTRHAPMQADPSRFGLANMAGHAVCYDTMFPASFLAETGFDLDGYCYYFKRNYELDENILDLYAAIELQVDHWKDLQRSTDVELSIEFVGPEAVVRDSRFGGLETIHLDATATALYQTCHEKVGNMSKRQAELSETYGGSSVERGFAQLIERRLCWTEGDLAMGLAVDRDVFDAHRESDWKSWWTSLC